MKKALLIIDLQNDFCTNGALAVPNAEEIIPIINKLIDSGYYDLIVASQDCHPAGHISFAEQHQNRNVFEKTTLDCGTEQIIWPVHCVENTYGAELHNELHSDGINYIQKKGTHPNIDSYSAFADNAKSAKTGLDEHLKEEGINELHVCGLATEYCVKFSIIDALHMLPGVTIIFIEDASRGLNQNDIQKAKEEIISKGVRIMNSYEILNEI